MAFRLRQIDVTAAGREIVRDRNLDKRLLMVGRSATNDIQLPDLAVEPRHATIELRNDGRVEVLSAGNLGFTLDGVTSVDATVDPASGAEIRFGPYRITVSLESDGAVLLLIRQVDDSDTKGDLEEKLGFSLTGVLPGKRRASWIAAGVVVLLFLLFPLGGYIVSGATGTVVGDSAWSSGKLSISHHALEEKCESCHVRPFQSVRDETCIGCHKNVGDHAAAPRMIEARTGAPLGSQLLAGVAHAFGKEGPGSCASCHVEHEGFERMAAPAQQFCSDCHATMKEKVPETVLGDAGDFGTLHPQFAPAVVTDPFTRKATKVSLDAMPRENNGLTFPHKLHLDKMGGVARMAASIGAERGYGTKGMECKDCHHPTEDALRFKPIDMERDCEACHSLAYDRVGTIVRRLRHGDVQQMIADLSVSPNTNRPLVSDRDRPGEATGSSYPNFSRPGYNVGMIRDALSREGVCGECHTPTFENGLPGVVPVTILSRYMQHGWFDHKSHKDEKCASCHLAEKSNASTDLLLPGIKDCRVCHLGEKASSAKVPSGCAMCHSYHPPFAAPGRDRLARR